MTALIKKRRHKLFNFSKIMALSITTGLLVTGCVTAEESIATPHTEAPTTSTSPGAHNSDGSLNITQCGAFTAAKEQTMCTMQYDPVCVKHKAPNGQISYKTAGNACMACTTATAISYTPGECGTGLPTK